MAQQWDNSANSWQNDWWQCAVCGSYTAKPKAKCRQCGIKKSWAPTWGKQETWDDHYTSSQYTSQGKSHGEAQSSQAIVQTLQGEAQPQEQQSPEELSGIIKELETSLASLPDKPWFIDTRVQIKDRIDKTKRQITLSKPVHAQLSACASALERAKQTRQTASDALEAAEHKLKEENDAVDRLASEMESLERAVASKQGQQSSVEHVAGALRGVMNEFKQHSKASPTDIQQAQGTMEAFFSQLSAMMLQCQTPKPPELPAAAKTVQGVRRRAAQKRPSSVPPSPLRGDNAMSTDHIVFQPLTRCRGKQPGLEKDGLTAPLPGGVEADKDL